MDYTLSGQVHTSPEKQKAGTYEYIYVLMLMLYAGRSIIFFERPSITENPIGVLLPVIMSGILAIRWRVYFTIEFYMVLLFFLVYFLAVSIKYYDLRPTFLLTYYLLFFVVYVTIKSLKFNIFILFEKILFYFAAISLFLWSIQVAAGGDFLFNIISRFAFLYDWSFVSGDGLSTIVYSIQPYETTVINNHVIARNCGFAWEPGSYASYLNIGIFVNLFIARDQGRKRRFWVLFVAILSTMSTTGYVLLAVIMVFYLMSKDIKKILLLLPVALAILIILFSLPFMKDKIIDLIQETQSIQQIVYDSYGRENPTTPQRFSSFLIALVDFKENPVLGLATHTELSWTDRIGSRISAISGIGNHMAQFGLVGIIPFIILLFRSSIIFSEYFQYKGKMLLFIIIFLIAVSYTILMIPFIMCFWMFALFEPDIALEKRRVAVQGAEGITA